MRQRICLLFLLACAAFFAVSLGFVARALDLRAHDFRPGIGEPEQAKIKIEGGMTKDEVRSLLGRPHCPRDAYEYDDEWTFRCDFFGGTLFRVHFGNDDRVTHTEWWLN